MKRPTKENVVKPKTSNNVLGKTVNTKNDAIPIVGIGASAGGLEALEEFFKNMAIDSGMAFVVIQHLDPNHKAILTELLQRITKMKVLTVTDRLKVKPNQVYVIPPNKSMSILKGALRLFEPIEMPVLRLPIDFFFRSLADDMGQQSIGIVLSGMGSDGSLGLKAIKEKNGRVLVQEPASAKFDSMPRNAIKSVTVDIIAPASELPSKLLSSAKSNDIKTTKPAIKKDITSLEKIIILLRAQTGNDFSQYKKSTLYRRIERRMGIHQISKIAAYVRYLQENPAETEILFKELLIGVTSFFRDTGVWKHLKENVFPSIFSNLQNQQVLRAWVPACSTGEEAYSLAIIFKEAIEEAKLDKNVTLQIFATDLDNGAIEQARKGVYLENIVADVSENRLTRFFVKTNNHYSISAQIREMIVFASQNIIKDPPFTRLNILSCRNMLIYMDSDLQEKLLSLFHYSLNEKGFLILGSAETTGNKNKLFTTVNSKFHIYQSTGALKTEELYNFPSSFTQTKNHIKENMNIKKIPDNIQSLTDDLLLQQFSPASILATNAGDILYLTGNTGKYLTPAAGKASMNIFTMARAGLQNKLPIAFRKATKNYEKSILHNVKIGTNGGSLIVDVTLQQIEKPSGLKGRIMVIFNDVPFEKQKITKNKKTKGSTQNLQTELVIETQRLTEELQTTREEMQTSHEELKTINEELQSSNEELQSTNEELTTSKEEMQSMNEELTTLNVELQNKIEDTGRVTNDINNLLNSSKIAALFLDKELKIRKFTFHTTKIFKLIDSDIGRHFTDLTNNLNYPELLTDTKEVLRTLMCVEKTISSSNGLYYTIRIMPYRTSDDKIEGLILNFIDTTKPHLLKIKLLETRKQYQELFNSMVEMFQVIELIYDNDGKVCDYYYRDVNPAFEKLVGKTKKELINKRVKNVFKVIEDHWLEAYDKVIKTGKPLFFENYDAEFDKYYEINAWKVSENRIGVIFHDVTERKHSEKALLETQNILKSLINKVPGVIIALSSNGEIIEFNPEAQKVFGRKRNEVIGENYFDLFISDSLRKEVKLKMKQLLSDMLPNQFVNIVASANGKQLKIEWTANKLFNQKGVITGIIAIGKNITPL